MRCLQGSGPRAQLPLFCPAVGTGAIRTRWKQMPTETSSVGGGGPWKNLCNSSSRDFRISGIALTETGTESLQERGSLKCGPVLCPRLPRVFYLVCSDLLSLSPDVPVQPYTFCLIASRHSRLWRPARTHGSTSSSLALLSLSSNSKPCVWTDKRSIWLAHLIFHTCAAAAFGKEAHA